MLNAKNNAVTILSASINSSITSLTVADASVLPVVPFVITIDNEIMTVTNVVGNVLTVTRGAESTAPTSHLAGVPVENRWTAGMYDALVDRGSANPFPSMPYIGSAPIIESGVSGDARYIKYEDGTVIQYTLFSDGGGTWTAGLRLDRSWTFPIPFIAQPSVSFLLLATSALKWFYNMTSLSNTAVTVSLFNADSVSDIDRQFSFIAIGRWK